MLRSIVLLLRDSGPRSGRGAGPPSPSGSRNQASTPQAAVAAEYRRMTLRRPCRRSRLPDPRLSSGKYMASALTASRAKPAAARPRPPSRTPKARPCEVLPPQSRAMRIIAAQNRKMVVTPQ